MKFLILNTNYSESVDWLYFQHPGLEKEPYEEQMRVWAESLGGTANFYSCNLQKLGHDPWAIIPNIEPAQKQWARENGVDENTKWCLRLRRGVVPWPYQESVKQRLYRILRAQVTTYRPDVLYCMAIETIGSDFLRSVKGYYRLAIGQNAAPLPNHDISEYELMLSSLPNQVDYFRKQGMASELFRLGFEPTILSRLFSSGKRYDVAFVGGLGGPHEQGTKVLEQLCRQHCVTVWGYGANDLAVGSPIRAAYLGPIWGIQMYQVLRDAKIVFNRHIDIAEDYANNMRLYEATGVGSLLVTDWKRNLHEMFEPGNEVIAYRTPEECAELIHYYLEHNEEREAITRAGQQRTLREHTYYQRMQELVDIVRKYLGT